MSASTITITEALAELKVIADRVSKKSQFVQQYVTHPAGMRDPLLKQGGSQALIAAEIQSINDLTKRGTSIRTAINQKNLDIPLTIEGTTRSVAEWLVWRREWYPQEVGLYTNLQKTILNARNAAVSKGGSVTNDQTSANPTDQMVYVDESEVRRRIEFLGAVNATLDGKLSLHNATVTITV